MINKTWAMTGLATAVAILGGLGLSACNDGDTLEISQGVAIQDATIVNTRDGSTQAHMTLWVDGGKIQKISSYRKVKASGSAQVVDAQGKYLVPGFQDMHTHAMSAAAQSPTYWPMFVASGITGVREMGGSPDWIAKAKALNAANAAGTGDVSLATPEILLIPGPILNGVPTAAAAIQQVQAQKAMGADFIKLVSGSRDAVLAAISESKAQGLTLAGHLTTGVSAIEASDAGQRAIEHLGSGIGILLDCAGETDAVRQALLTGQGANPPFPPTFVTSPFLYRTLDAQFYQRVMDSYDEAKCQSVAQVLAKNTTWQVPTLVRLHTMLMSDAAEFRNDPNLQYVDRTAATLWEQLAQQYAGTVPDSARATFAAFYAQEQKLIKVLKAAGVKMLAGSDITGIWVIPGVSLHQEFHELAAAGLTPLEILQMTTLNPAQFLGREATMGTVEEGRNADLVLLDGNPVNDVNQLDKVHAVFLKGRYLPSDTLAKLKSDVAAAYKAQPLRVLSSAIDPSHVD